MLKALLAAGAVSLMLASAPAAASLGHGLSLPANTEFSGSGASVQIVDFAQGHETVPLNLKQPAGIKAAVEIAESARYDGFNTLLTLVTLLSAAGVFVAASLATARKDDERLAESGRREDDREAEAGWKGDVMRALEAELLNIDRVATRRAA